MQDLLPTLVSDPTATDLRIFPLGNGTYTSAKFYNFMFDGYLINRL
jgi:tetrahydromethanopterin S-methyltransferase subunit B